MQSLQPAPRLDRCQRIRRRIPKPLRFYRKACVTERRSGLSFQLNERLGKTLVSPDTHGAHMGNEITIGKEEFCRENLRSDFKGLIQIGLIAIRDAEVSITEIMFQLVGHREDHRILRQTFRKHHSWPKVIVNKRAAQISEPVGPLVNFDSVMRVDSFEIGGEHAR